MIGFALVMVFGVLRRTREMFTTAFALEATHGLRIAD